jgi:hypothetical protein
MLRKLSYCHFVKRAAGSCTLVVEIHCFAVTHSALMQMFTQRRSELLTRDSSDLSVLLFSQTSLFAKLNLLRQACNHVQKHSNKNYSRPVNCALRSDVILHLVFTNRMQIPCLCSFRENCLEHWYWETDVYMIIETISLKFDLERLRPESLASCISK